MFLDEISLIVVLFETRKESSELYALVSIFDVFAKDVAAVV